MAHECDYLGFKASTIRYDEIAYKNDGPISKTVDLHIGQIYKHFFLRLHIHTCIDSVYVSIIHTLASTFRLRLLCVKR